MASNTELSNLAKKLADSSLGHEEVFSISAEVIRVMQGMLNERGHVLQVAIGWYMNETPVTASLLRKAIGVFVTKIANNELV